MSDPEFGRFGGREYMRQLLDDSFPLSCSQSHLVRKCLLDVRKPVFDKSHGVYSNFIVQYHRVPMYTLPRGGVDCSDHLRGLC